MKNCHKNSMSKATQYRLDNKPSFPYSGIWCLYLHPYGQNGFRSHISFIMLVTIEVFIAQRLITHLQLVIILRTCGTYMHRTEAILVQMINIYNVAIIRKP